jgi:hypothetical protein
MGAGKRSHGRALRRLALATLAVGACGALGCAGLGGKRWGEHPVTVTEVVVLSQHGVAPEAIVAKMRRGGTIYHLSDAQYAALRQKGVTPAVIAYMQAAHAEAVKEFPKLANDEDLSCWNLGFDGYWYAGGPWGLHPDC